MPSALVAQALNIRTSARSCRAMERLPPSSRSCWTARVVQQRFKLHPQAIHRTVSPKALLVSSRSETSALCPIPCRRARERFSSATFLLLRNCCVASSNHSARMSNAACQPKVLQTRPSMINPSQCSCSSVWCNRWPLIDHLNTSPRSTAMYRRRRTDYSTWAGGHCSERPASASS
jgi:hypothetical protein